MTKFKASDKVTVKKYEGYHVCLTYQDILEDGGPNGVIRGKAIKDEGCDGTIYGVILPGTGKWYIREKDLKARK